MKGWLGHKSANGDPQVTNKQPVSKHSYTYFDMYAVLLWEINDDCSGDTVKVKKKGHFYGTVQQGTSIHIHNHVLPQTNNLVKMNISCQVPDYMLLHMLYIVRYTLVLLKINMLREGFHIEEEECRHTNWRWRTHSSRRMLNGTIIITHTNHDI
jgi:hypothetical protein